MKKCCNLIVILLLQLWCGITVALPHQRPWYPSDPRIINGTEAIAENTKHQVSLRRRLNEGFFFGTGHICGGSLIDYNVVLTANHCFLDLSVYNGTLLPAEDFVVVMGNLDRFENNNNTLVYDIERIVFKVNGTFNVSTYEDDLALIYLNGTVPRDHPTVAPINYTHTEFAPGTMCQVTGWGITEDGYTSDKLMTVDVPLIARDVCANDTDFDPDMIIDGMLCAGYMEGQKDACNGDSGGALVCNGLQAGIVSWGIDCAQPQLPGVYTDVAYYARWIDEQLGRDTAAISSVSLPLALALALLSVRAVLRF